MRGFSAGGFATDPSTADPAVIDSDMLEVECDALDNVVSRLGLRGSMGLSLMLKGVRSKS